MTEIDGQLALLQIGAYVAKHLPENELPQSLDQVALIVHKNLGVEIKQGDSLTTIRNKIVTAIHEQQELEEIGEWFYAEMKHWMLQDMLAMEMAESIKEQIDTEILNDIAADAKKENQFTEAMKIV